MLERIKEQAKKNGWTMKYLSQQLGLTHCYFTDVKNGKTTLSTDRLNKIAQILNCSVEYLKGETDDASKPGLSPEKQKLLNLIDTLTDEQAERFAELIKTMR